MKSKISLIAFLGTFAFSLSCHSDSLLSLTVEIEGFQLERGQVIVSIFSSEESFLEQTLESKTLPVGNSETLTTTFDKLPSGIYAVTAVYDEDSNGELNTGFLGIPTELVGVSNNAKGLFGPPSFEDASFGLNSPKTIYIQLGKAKD